MSRSKWIILSIALLIAGIVFLPIIEIYTINAFICLNTGKRHGYTEWIFGLRTDNWEIIGPLEPRLSQLKINLENNWVQFNGTSHNIFGNPMLFSHGRPGEILHLHEEYMTQIINGMSDAEIEKLVKVPNDSGRNLLQEIVNTTAVDYPNKPWQ